MTLCCCGFVESWKAALEPLLLLYGVSTFSTKQKKERNTTMKGYVRVSTIPRSTIHFFFFIVKRSVNNEARQGRSQQFNPTTKQCPTAMQRHTNFPLTGPLRASTGRSRTLSQTDKSARLSGSCKISIIPIY